MTDDEIRAAIEQRVQRVLDMDGHPSAQVRQDARRLALDVQGLLDRLRAVTAERDQAESAFGYQVVQTIRARIDRDHARDQVAAVRALGLELSPALPEDYRLGWRDAVLAVRRALDSAQPQDTPETCPSGCGCRKGTNDADRTDCACDGPCCMSDDPAWDGPATPQDTPDDSEWQALADAWTPAARAAAADNIRSALRLKDSPLARARLDYLATPQDTPDEHVVHPVAGCECAYCYGRGPKGGIPAPPQP